MGGGVNFSSTLSSGVISKASALSGCMPRSGAERKPDVVAARVATRPRVFLETPPPRPPRLRAEHDALSRAEEGGEGELSPSLPPGGCPPPLLVRVRRCTPSTSASGSIGGLQGALEARWRCASPRQRVWRSSALARRCGVGVGA